MSSPAPALARVSYVSYLALVFPFVISTLTTPLLGAVDTALVGHLPDPAFIGGVAIGAVIFSTLYWLFGFLRVSTTGFTAQALDDPRLLTSALFRPLLMAVVIGLAFVALQYPIFSASMALLKPDAAVRQHAHDFFFILIWGAPFTLVNYVCLGWLMGRLKTRAVLLNQIGINVLNMVLALWFVRGLEWGVPGIAGATLIAQISGTLLGLRLIHRYLTPNKAAMSPSALLSWREFKAIMMVNGDLMLRTVCLLVVTNHFVATGASFGTEMLAANAVLFQIHYLMAYLFDGFANASSVFSGRARGANDADHFRQTLRYSALSTLWMSGLLALLWAWQGDSVIGWFTHQGEIVALCQRYSLWLMVFPLCGAAGIIFYGVFTGITYTAPVRNSMLLALMAWFVAWYFLVPVYGNHGLWLAYLAFSLGRSGFLLLWLPGASRRLSHVHAL
ncbi:MATE family efflux transporter [Candidatus Symbiopectobacterium sp. NZEC135]|uniref:MATE family efflux transporter n=1 Tax=Candidatus Symbiopectobacterium sp. NZEC135 TaxID=2820471 RepID=UPI002226C617|nr:MATE family efflux transporter [Candidatus Symbiopectobacterium sp. NZEC135]MCW2479640.1 MATE family efflux transporter [Candidatus Symbiopectobacterium sp. NZEC135]